MYSIYLSKWNSIFLQFIPQVYDLSEEMTGNGYKSRRDAVGLGARICPTKSFYYLL